MYVIVVMELRDYSIHILSTVCSCCTPVGSTDALTSSTGTYNQKMNQFKMLKIMSLHVLCCVLYVCVSSQTYILIMFSYV